MGNVVVRAYSPDDREGFGHIRAVTYRGGEPVLPDDRILRDDCLGFVAEADGELVGAATVLDMTATKHGSALRCAGIAAVAVPPEKRRSGVGSQLMTGILPLLRDAGFAMASLYPFRASYYRQFGYEVAGTRLNITCPTHRLPKPKSDLNVRHLKASDWEQIIPAYTQFANRYAGMNLRDPDQWWRLLGGNNPLEIYVAGDPIEAYAILRIATGFWGKQPIKELVWNSRRGYDALLGLIAGLTINNTEAEWSEPLDSPFLSVYNDQGTDVAFNRALMYRILDVPACLKVLRARQEGKFTIDVSDAEIPSNAGAWKVDYDTAQVNTSRTESASIRSSIGHLTQAFLGDPGFEGLWRNGVIDVGSQADRVAAAGLLSQDFVYCTDFF